MIGSVLVRVPHSIREACVTDRRHNNPQLTPVSKYRIIRLVRYLFDMMIFTKFRAFKDNGKVFKDNK